MITKHKNISMVRGDTLSFGINFRGLGGLDLDELYFSCSSNYMSEDYVFVKTLGNGVTKSEDPETSDTYIIRTEPGDTETAIPGLYYYDVEAHIHGDTFTVLSGNLEIIPDVTYEPQSFLEGRSDYGSDIDFEEYFQILDAIDNDFNISDSEFCLLIVGLTKDRSFKAGATYKKNVFVRYDGDIYRAREKLSAKETRSWNGSKWEKVVKNYATNPQKGDNVSFNVKDLFTNMMEYVDRYVDYGVAKANQAVDSVKKEVASEAKIRYTNDYSAAAILKNKANVASTKHKYTISKINKKSVVPYTIYANAEGQTTAKATPTTKKPGWQAVAIGGFALGNDALIPIQVYIETVSAKKGTAKIIYRIRNTSDSDLENVPVWFWLLWSKTGETPTLNKA